MNIEHLIEIEERLVVGKYKQKFYADLEEFSDRDDYYYDYEDDWFDAEHWDDYLDEVEAGLYDGVRQPWKPDDSFFPGWTEEEINQYYRELDEMYEYEGW